MIHSALRTRKDYPSVFLLMFKNSFEENIISELSLKIALFKIECYSKQSTVTTFAVNLISLINPVQLSRF